MTNLPANHFDASGSGIEMLVDTNGLNGEPIARVTVDGENVDVDLTKSVFGYELQGVVRAIPDAEQVAIRIAVPQVNVGESPLPFAALATLVTARSGFAPRLVEGVIHSYELRPLAGTASVVDSIAPGGAKDEPSSSDEEC